MKKLLARVMMFVAILAIVPYASGNTPGSDDLQAPDLNVNSRYTIESVQISGWHGLSISDPLRTELNRFVGAKLNHPELEKLAARIKRELRVSEVAIKVARGTEPDHVIVNFEATEAHQQKFDVNVAKFLYDSRQGWSGDGEATTRIGGNAFTFGLLSDGDELLERFSGIRARFERASVGSDRLRFRFEFDDYHQQWNPATMAVAGSSEIYRSRQLFMPEATLVIFQPLELSFGVSFARYRPVTFGGFVSDGVGSAAKTESSNAVVTSLRYHQRWGSAQDVQQQELTGSYALQAATNIFGTDAIYTRHMVDAQYHFRHMRHLVDVRFLAGRITGDAPLFDRFVLGNSSMLRGWDKFALDPLGGSHVVAGSIDYQYRILHVFYDTGAIWDVRQEREQKQSVGCGFKKEGFQLAVAFPLRAGHMEPIFYTGLNF